MPAHAHLALFNVMQDYYAPIITAYEAHIAFAPGQQWTGDYSMDFSCLLVHLAPERIKTRVSQWQPQRKWSSTFGIVGDVPVAHQPSAMMWNL